VNMQKSSRRRHAVQRALALGGTAALLTGLAGCHDDNDYVVLPGPGYVSAYVPNSVAIADVNHDGTPDLLVATTIDQGGNNPGIAAVYTGTSASPGTYQPGATYAITGTDPSGIAALDLSGSGGIDLVVSNFGSGNASVFMHDPANAGKYLPATTLTTGGQPNQVVSADINADGKPTTGTRGELTTDAYPYARNLYIYIRREPGTPFDPLVKEYMRLILSREGQQAVARDPKGYLPLNAADVAREVAKLDKADTWAPRSKQGPKLNFPFPSPFPSGEPEGKGQ